jgi:hypothetical protein
MAEARGPAGVRFFFALLALKNRVGAWIWAILELLLVEGLMFLFDRKTTLPTSKQQLNVAIFVVYQ